VRRREAHVQPLSRRLPQCEFAIHAGPIILAISKINVTPPEDGLSSGYHGIVQIGGRPLGCLGFVEQNDAVVGGESFRISPVAEQRNSRQHGGTNCPKISHQKQGGRHRNGIQSRNAKATGQIIRSNSFARFLT
jgi:hypothetical protein